ncbi:hypothetical protein BYT27DRAFT_7240480 [Phlegmacium glaucopus]|nr:hypothetical protein BYT27DRAFT_7240480 [Phlegmacium glaucopus]
MYLQGASKKGPDKRKNIFFYALCALYALSVIIIGCDIATFIYAVSNNSIYRCWILWGCNIRVMILPSILAFVFLVIWLASAGPEHILSGRLVGPHWAYWMILAGVAVSMTVNALVTCLIVFKIFKVYHEVKSTSDDQSLGATNGSKIRTVIFIVIESGMALLSIQLARLMVMMFVGTDAGVKIFFIIVPIHQVLNGIAPTIILVRVSMGLSFHDKESIESTIGSLHFAASSPNSMSETEAEDVGIVNRDDDIVVQQSDDIEMVDR